MPKTRIRCEMSKPLSETGAGETSPAAACSADRGHCYARTRAQDCVGDLERALSDQWVLENQPILWLNFGNGLLQDLFCKRAGVVGMDVHANHLVTDSERMVAATVVQWLGTNCGREFLEKAFARAGWKLRCEQPNDMLTVSGERQKGSNP